MGSKKRGGAVDWTAGHPPAWAAVNAAGVSALTAAAGYLADAPMATGIGEGVVGAVASLAVSSARKYTRGHRIYRCAAWLAAGGWTSWALTVGPWSSPWPALTLAAGAILGWGANAAYAEWEAGAPERRRLAELAAQREQKRGEWEDRFARVCGVTGCSVDAVEPWEPDETGRSAGYTLEVSLPAGGTTVEELARHTDALRSDMRLPDGCTLEIVRGANHGTALVRVNDRNIFAEIIHYPDDLSPKSINDPITVGRHKDGTKAQGSLRFHSGLLIGQPEGGKTNLLNVINAELARCVDVLIWHIDITGAGITLPWLRAWAVDGTAPRPVVDWSASTVDEALAMLKVAAEIIAMRKASYQHLMFEEDDDKIPVSPDIPEIIIIADEAAELPQSVQDGIGAVNNTGRAAGVRTMSCALRATRDMVSASQKEMTRWRIGMRVSDASEYQHLFSDYRAVDVKDAPVPGSGFMEWNGSSPRPFLGYRIKPGRIREISNVVADRRPKLDEVSLRIDSAKLYEERWIRTLPKLFRGTPLAPAAAHIMDQSPTVTLSSAEKGPATAAGGNEETGGIDMDALFPMQIPDDIKDSPSAAPPPSIPAQEKREEPQGNGSDPEFQRLIDDSMMWDPNLLASAQPQPPEQPRPTLAPAPAEDRESVTDPAQRCALELLAATRTEGLAPGVLHEKLRAQGFGTSRQTVHEWLARWVTRGWVGKVRREGGKPAYMLAEHADAAPGERIA